jgi:membrane protease YdiL (CAAX protease family)
MNKVDNQIPEVKEKPVAYWIGMFVFYMVMAAFSTGFIVNGLLSYIFNNDNETVIMFITQPDKFEGKQAVFVAIQALSSMLLFIGGSYFFLKKENGFLFHTLTNESNTPKQPLIYETALLIIIALPTFSLIGEINQEFIKSILDAEALQRLLDLDEKTTALYNYLLGVKAIPVLILSILGIAVVPGVGEEIVFRGVFQNLFKRATENKHMAIWISAFIFSAIHLEFSNFILRLLIGALFGYMYEWTKNIYIPIVAHVTYNSTSLFLGYLFTNEFLSPTWNESSLNSSTWVYILIYSLIPIGLIYTFYKKTKRNVV